MKPSFDDAYCRLAANYAKNYCNRTPIVKVIVENVMCFWDTVYSSATATVRPKSARC